MSIRFQCQSCSQPIEVDDEWAGKAVVCPFCSATINAPEQSTLTELVHIPTASPIAVSSAEAKLSHPVTTDQPVPKRNTVAVVSLMLTGLFIFLQIVGAMIVSPHSIEIINMQEKYQASDQSTDAQMRILNDFISHYGGEMPGWFIAYFLIQLTAIPVFLAAMICAIIGIRRTHRRSMATTSLVICSGIFFIILVSTIVSV